MSIHKVKANLNRFHSRKNPAIRLPFPISSALRLAQLSPGPAFDGVQPLTVNRLGDLPSFAPNVLIGSLREVQSFAAQSACEALDTSFIDHALVILTPLGSKPLSDVARVALWQSFGVPLFELYLSLDLSLLASECEAHEGWHLAPGISFETLNSGELILDGEGNSGLRTGLRASLDQTGCPCGHPSARLLDIEHLRTPDARYLAVSA